MNNVNIKRKVIIGLLICFFVGMILTLLINSYMVISTKDKIIDINEVNDIDNVDAILILGCRVNGDSPSLMLSKRLDKGYDVYNLLDKKIIVSGDNTRQDYDEVNVMANELIEMGIREEDIYKDYAGISTYDSIYRAKYIFGVKKIVIVTQKYHMYRALYIANSLDIDAVGIVADDIPQKSVMLKNEIREIFSRDKNFFKVIFKPKSKYLGDLIPINE